jgi:hypothetical protein
MPIAMELRFATGVKKSDQGSPSQVGRQRYSSAGSSGRSAGRVRPGIQPSSCAWSASSPRTRRPSWPPCLVENRTQDTTPTKPFPRHDPNEAFPTMRLRIHWYSLMASNGHTRTEGRQLIPARHGAGHGRREVCFSAGGLLGGNVAGWLASVVVGRRGRWSSLLVTCQPVGASGRPFAPDYANGADACASPSILRPVFASPLPAWSFRLPRVRYRHL